MSKKNSPDKAEKVVKPTAQKKPIIKKTTVKKAKPETGIVVESKQLETPNSRVWHFSRFTDFDIALFKQGTHYKLYEKFGSHVMRYLGITGTYFAVWAPNAKYVSVIGNFNGWEKGSHPLSVRWDESGIWEGFVPNTGNGEAYKYFIESVTGEKLEKADPFALRCELPPRTASIIWDTWYEWNDENWLETRKKTNVLNQPMSVYEVHFGSWARNIEAADDFLSYREMADKLVPYVKEMNFTHVEFMPLMEHPFYPSWGYQITGYFAATSRYGTPQDLMYLIDKFHENDIAVIFDWVPSHFPGDAHGLYNFDGTHLYEHADMRKGFHPDWKSYIFNYGRNEVKSFLISNAVFLMERYHIDALRVDAVASMLYLDYSRKHGEWETNQFGGRENLEAISFLKQFNEVIYGNFSGVQTIAEESTSFTGVSKPTYLGGLGFGQKWMMGWMNDTIKYFEKDSAYRLYHHNQITFSTNYAFSENFMLPLSHDEVVYGKKSMVYKMPGDEWQQFANLRALYAYMFTHPGTKLMFMGDEFGQTSEWNLQQSLDWHLLQFSPHVGMSKYVKALNILYKSEPALYEKSFESAGFEWIVNDDATNSVLVYARKGNHAHNDLLIAINLTPVPRKHYRFGVTQAGVWKEIFNSDSTQYWGSGHIANQDKISEGHGIHGKAHSIIADLPPLAMIVFKKR